MYLYCIESCPDCEPDSIAVGFHDFIYLGMVHLVDKGRGVEIESPACPVRHASAYPPVRHVAAMPELDGGLCPFGMYCIREFFQIRDYLLPHPELSFK